jgi:superfamily II DNA or RNA helicase
MNKRDEIQKQLIKQVIENKFRGIHLISPRVGKCRIYLTALKELNLKKILIFYPTIDIQKSWEKECDVINFHPDITFSTYISYNKAILAQFDAVICDEAHSIPSENILPKLGAWIALQPHVVLCSGTYSNNTLFNLELYTLLKFNIDYSLEKAIKDDIICDFNIFVHTYSLDGNIINTYGTTKKWKSTDAKECRRLSFNVDVAIGEKKKWAALNRMRFINSCNSLINVVKEFLSNNNERLLLFASDEKVGKQFSIPMYNSKSINDNLLQDFQNEKISELCLIRKGGTGVSYRNLQTIVITSINSNGENLEQYLSRALILDTDVANIHIFVSNEPFQQKWLKSALTNINKEKIKYI